MGYFVGAYASSPAFREWDAEAEGRYFEVLRGLPGIAGLEIPFQGSLHRYDAAWFLKNIHPGWNFVITCIPGTMDTMAENPRFGLASDSESDRAAAVAYIKRACDAVAQLNAHLGRQAVHAVAVQSAPRRGVEGISSSAAALARSLTELRALDWQGAELCVEHCDALVSEHPPGKGFLLLADEIHAVKESTGATPVGILINWGRSAVEGQSTATPLEHIRTARAAGMLRAVMFSGATADDPLYGKYADTHAPFAETLPSSLMSVAHARECLAAAGPLHFTGFKIQALPKDTDLEARIRIIQASAKTFRAL